MRLIWALDALANRRAWRHGEEHSALGGPLSGVARPSAFQLIVFKRELLGNPCDLEQAPRLILNMTYEQFLAGRVRALCRAQEAAQAGTVDELDAFEVDEKLSDIARLEGHQFALKLRCGDQVKLACKREPVRVPTRAAWILSSLRRGARLPSNGSCTDRIIALARGCFRRGRSRAAARFSTAWRSPRAKGPTR